MFFLFLLSTGAYAAAWIWAVSALPERAPLHFGADGDVDSWGTRAEVLTGSALIGLVMAVLLAAVAWWTVRISLSSQWVNLPHKQWWTATPEREARARRMLRQDLHAVGALVMGLLTVVEFSLVWAAEQAEPRMPVFGIAGTVVAVVVILGHGLWMMLRRYRPDESPTV
ncbi:DUF1648 domain-containing protein [Nocardia brevicatena]|uniref:DUF1648 domain-containing protein n=1 Tax=Nocardia brevicatena TaxID=37327 RepID=UPI0012FAC787|nr:DUF1648 domain-containing protein [Nocardia brevicatena]